MTTTQSQTTGIDLPDYHTVVQANNIHRADDAKGVSVETPISEIVADESDPFIATKPPAYNVELRPRCRLAPYKQAFYSCKVQPNAYELPQDVVLSLFSAAVLLRADLITRSQLTPIVTVQDDIVRVDPTDPISGALSATAGAFRGIATGFASVPNEIAKTRSQLVSYPGTLESSDQVDGEVTTEQRAQSAKSKQREASGQYAKAVAVGSSKTLGHITLAACRVPFTLTRDIGRGFNHIPTVYKDPTVRKPVPISDITSGLKSAGLGFGYGMYDGLAGFFVQPYTEARKGGLVGFAKGCGYGLGGIICKPVAGYYGLVGDVYDGAERSWRQRHQARLSSAKDILAAEQREFETASEVERQKVCELWLNTFGS